MRPALQAPLAALALLALTVAPAQGGGPEGPILLPAQGPDVPAAGLPVATIHAIQGYLHTGDHIHAEVEAMPQVPWNRVFLTFRSWPVGDPWDRTFQVGVGMTEVLHGTTPRGNFTVREDITEYASLLLGAEATVWSRIDSWVCCGIVADVWLEFYDDPTYPAQEQAFDRVASPFRTRDVNGISAVHATFDFGPQAPARGVVELTTTGHGPQGEFWYQRILQDTSFPRFQIYVDGAHAGTVHALPYVYALVGFCCGATAEAINTALWVPGVTAQEAAGVHAVGGKVPPYRAEIPAHVLPLLTGTRDVSIVKETHGGQWKTSLSFLMDDAAP